jgi:outer membrane protein
MESFSVGVLLVLSSIICSPRLHAQQSVTITDVWAKVDANSKRIQQGKELVNAGKAAVTAAKDERLPELKLHGEYARVSNFPIYENGLFHTPEQFPVVHNTYGAGAEGYLNIYNGGTTDREIKSKQLEADIAAEKLGQTRTDMHFEAARLFLDIYRNRQYLQLVEKDIKQREEQLAEIDELHKNGVVLKSDVLRAELNLSNQQLLHTQVANSILLANQELNLLTGDPYESTLTPQVTEDLPDSTRHYSLDNAYLLHIAEKETELSKLHYKQVRSGLLPSVGLFAEYKYSYPQIMFYPYAISMYSFGMAGVKASYRLSELYLNKHKRATAAQLVKSHELEDADLHDLLQQQVSNHSVRYREAQTRIAVARQNIVRATETYRITRNTYFAQNALLTDLLDAETQLLQAQMNLVTEKVNAQVLYYQLLKTTGNL